MQPTERIPMMPLSLGDSLAPILSAGLMLANLRGKAFDAAVVVGSYPPSVSLKPESISQKKSICLGDQELILPSAFLRACGLRKLVTPLDVVIFEMTEHERINRFTSHESLMCQLAFLHILILFMVHAFFFWFHIIMCRSKAFTGLFVIGVYVLIWT